MIRILAIWLVLSLSNAHAETAPEALTDDAQIRSVMTRVLSRVAADQLRQLARNNPSCFHGSFKQEVSDHFYALAGDKRLHQRVLSFLGGVFTVDEIRDLITFYGTEEGEQAMFRFTKNIAVRQKKTLDTSHAFFSTELGKKIVQELPTLKRNAIWHGLLLLKDNGWGVGEVLMKKLNWQFKCKNAEEESVTS